MKLKEFLDESSGVIAAKNVAKDKKKIMDKLKGFKNLADVLASIDLSKKIDNVKVNLEAVTDELQQLLKK